MIRKLSEGKDFEIIAEKHQYHIEFKIYSIEGITLDGDILYHKKNSQVWPDPVRNIDESEIFCHGSVKWDGCSNWHFDEQDRCMLHAGSKDGIVDLFKPLLECWEIAKKELPIQL